MKIHWKHSKLNKVIVDELLEIEYNFRSNFIRYFLAIPSIKEEELELLDDLEFCFDFRSKSFTICNSDSEGHSIISKYVPNKTLRFNKLNVGAPCDVKELT